MGSCNFVWWTGFNGGDWPRMNDKVTSPFASQTVYGLKVKGFFPSEDKVNPKPKDLVRPDGTIAYPTPGVEPKTGMSRDDFKEMIQENPTPDFFGQ